MTELTVWIGWSWILVGSGVVACIACLGLTLWLYSRRKHGPSGLLSLAVERAQVHEKALYIDGFRIAYTEVGSGPPLLLVHGLGASSYCFRWMIAPLAQHFRVFTLDLPGFGQSGMRSDRSYDVHSQIERLEAFVAALDLRDVSLVGSSMGGLLCFHLAHRQPARIRSLIALSPALSVTTKIPPWMLNNGQKIFKRLLVPRTMRQVLKRVVARHELIGADVIQSYLQPYQHPYALHIVFESLRSLLDSQWTTKLLGLQIPILILWGERDFVLPVTMTKHLQELFPTAKFLIHPLAGHHLQEDDPVWVCEKILDWTQQTS